MKIASSWLKRRIAGGLVILLAAPMAQAAGVQSQEPLWGQEAQNASPTQTQPPDPGSQNRQAQSGTSPSVSAQTQSDTPKPVGTAAAPYEKNTGVAASRPAGAVIAPAKQRRARSILIRFAVIAGAAVAIGTAVALSRASPSRPN
jgi:hypothetical protein